ncbi:NUDIX hydrolase [Halolamina sediminis]|jgi:8-oxo-dGTP diphosphatase|uniref:NUDIX hydrolase n=1 Tax=Halolamina sediminis TaxID=1480675 RepID=UPI0006B41D12|nr:NUDIX domain-containing protein [Halolamina sediminis]
MPEPQYVVNVDPVIAREGVDGTEYLVIVRSDGEEHAPGMLGFPGGKVEAGPGESDVLDATAKREAREEAGVEIEHVEQVTSTTFELDYGPTCLNVVVTADYADGEAHVADPAEVAAVEWRSADAVIDDPDTPPWTAELLAEVVEYRS